MFCFHARDASIPRFRRCAPTARFRAARGCGKERSPAPCPSRRRREWRSSSFRLLLLAKGKTRLGAVDEAPKDGGMLVNHQQRDSQRSDIDDDRRRMLRRRPQKIDEQLHGRGRRDAAQRTIAPIGYAEKEEQQGAERCKQAQTKKHAERGGHPFSTFELTPHRGAVSKQYR